MVSSAVSSVLYLRDATGEHTETPLGSCVYCGDAASFHEGEFRTRCRVVGKTGDHHIEAVSKVCDGLRGDAFVATQEVGFDSLCETVNGTPRGIDTLIRHMGKLSSRSASTNPKTCFGSTVVQEDGCQDNKPKN